MTKVIRKFDSVYIHTRCVQGKDKRYRCTIEPDDQPSEIFTVDSIMGYPNAKIRIVAHKDGLLIRNNEGLTIFDDDGQRQIWLGRRK